MRPLDFPMQRLHVLESPAEILRRAGPRAFERLWATFAAGPLFKNDLMNPFVCEIVAIKNPDRQTALAEEVLHRQHRLILELARGLVFKSDRADDIHQPLALAVAEFMRALVFPAHQRLHRIAELDECHLCGNREPTPDLRLDAVEENFHQHPVLVLGFRHARSLCRGAGEKSNRNSMRFPAATCTAGRSAHG